MAVLQPNPMCKSPSAYIVYINVIFYFAFSIITAAAQAEPIPFKRPKFGIEATFTNPTLQLMQTEDQYEVFQDITAKGDEAEVKTRVDELANEFPEQISLYVQLLIALNEELYLNIPSGLILNKGNPSGMFVFSEPFNNFLSFQFEWQAIEMQATAGTIPTYEQRRPLFDKTYAFLAAQNLSPNPNFGMGHIHMGFDEELLDHPEIIRNFIVSMMNDDRFWGLVGLDIEAKIMSRTTRKKWATYIEIFDQWLERARTAATREEIKKICEEMIQDLMPNQTKEDPSGVRLYLAQITELGTMEDLTAGLRRLLSRFIRYKMHYLLHRHHAFVYNHRTDTFEFRRIPAQNNVDEMILWMKLIEGYWQAAHEQKELIAFIKAPKKLERGYDEVNFFNKFILAAKQNPEDYRQFLSPELKKVRVFYNRPATTCEQQLIEAPAPL